MLLPGKGADLREATLLGNKNHIHAPLISLKLSMGFPFLLITSSICKCPETELILTDFWFPVFPLAPLVCAFVSECVCVPIIDKTVLNLGFGERGKNRQRHHQEQITDGTHTICSTHQQLHIWKTEEQYAKYNVSYSHG